jgi:D-inositol-3-phosphate glycosyltransferase
MLLFVGRIEPLKGLDVLIEAISIIRRSDTWNEHPFCLAIIGGDPEESSEQASAEMERIKSLTAQYALQDLVTFLGKRSQDSLPYYYSAAEAVVVPSQYESFGMVAMACGTPVVASQIGGLAYLVQDGVTGFTVPVDDPEELANRLTMLIIDPGLRARMAGQAVQLAQNYAWEKIAAKLIDLYDAVLRIPLRDQAGNSAAM